MTEIECSLPAFPSAPHCRNNLSLKLLFQLMGLILIILEKGKE